MLFNERASTILEKVRTNSVMKNKELADILGVSTDTVRRDLAVIEKEGLIKKIHGGASVPDSIEKAIAYGTREIANRKLKKAAAAKAVKKIEPNDLVALNGGTTNVLLARELTYLDIPFSVLTNNLAVIEILKQKPSIEIINVGGAVDHSEQATYGIMTLKMYKSYFPNIAFYSVNAINKENGFSDFRVSEIQNMQTIVKQANKNYAVMDSTKLNQQSKQKVLSVGQIDGVFMDDNVPTREKEEYKEIGLDIF